MNYELCVINKCIKMLYMTRSRLTLILPFIFLLSGCQSKHGNRESVENPVPVVALRVSKIISGNEISLSGNIEGIKTVRLGFMVAGKVDFIAANEGEPVSKGKLLASLDPESYSIAKELADIQVNQVQDEFDRLKVMHDNKSVSESDFAKVNFGLQMAKAQQKLHAKNLADTKLYSPIDGVLLKKLCEVGEITGTGIPLFVVSDIRKIKVSAFIPENELRFVKTGQKAKVTISSLNKDYEGAVVEVGSAADAASRSFSVKIEVDNPGLLIRPGMIAEVSMSSGKGNDTLVIPAEALQHDFNDQSFVFVADTVKNRAFRRNIVAGQLINDKIEVITGLNEKEMIITGGQQKLVDGSSIIIK
ncbi:MAG: efflux RND transporter periplasmic adaptor subunit [Bacteroidales bacterium]